MNITYRFEFEKQEYKFFFLLQQIIIWMKTKLAKFVHVIQMNHF